MVAKQIALGRMAALATVAVLMMTVMPLPGAQAQAIVDISVNQGEARFFQNNYQNGRAPTSFIDGGTSSVTLQVPVYSTSAQPVNNVPVYWFFTASEAVASGCVPLNLPAQTTAGPGMALANITVNTRDLVAGEYRIRVQALTRPGGETDTTATAPLCQPPSGQTMTRPCSTATLTNCVTDNPATDNNGLLSYFVKDKYLDLHIAELRWCPGTYDTTSGCNVEMIVNSQQYNTTAQNVEAWPTYIEAVVENKGTWESLSNFGGPCECATDGWGYDLNVSIAGPTFAKTYYSINETTANRSLVSEGVNGHRARSLDFDLVEKTGIYNVTVKLDSRGQLRRAPTDTSVDIGMRDIDVLSRDYTAEFRASDLRTTPSAPYPYDRAFIIAGNVTLKNIGSAPTPVFPNTLTKVNYTIYIDNLASIFQTTKAAFTPGEDGTQTVAFAFDANPNDQSPKYIQPGHHKVIVALDVNSEVFESNETNNIVAIDIYIADNSKPVFSSEPEFSPGALSLPERSTYFPLESFNVFANVTDDDNALRVVANFTLKSNTSISREYTLVKQLTNYALSITNFTFHDFDALGQGGGENWSMVVRAADSSGNNVSYAPKTLQIIPWPIHDNLRANGSNVVLQPIYPNDTIAWEGAGEPTWRIRVTPNLTGFYGPPATRASRNVQEDHNQQDYTGNLGLTLTTAKNQTIVLNGSFWRADSPAICLTNGTAANGNLPSLPGGGDPCATGGNADANNTFRLSVLKGDYGPGVWNYSVSIKDVAGFPRYFNGTILIEDSPPQLTELNISTDHIDPGQNITIRATLADDDNEISAAHVNFTRTSPADGAYVNLTLTDFTTVPGEGKTFFMYNQTFKTGRHEQFGLGGTFNVNVSARDLTGNWNSASLGVFTIKDEDAPVITQYGVVPGAVEIGENVTFWAKVSDTTNVTMKLEIFRTLSSSELLRDAISLTEALDGNFTATLNFSAEASHAWRLTATDSVNRAGALGVGKLDIRDNLGPRYDIRSPAVVLEGIRYASATPRIEIAIFDSEGVVPSSIDLKVGGLPVDFDVLPAPGHLNGYLVTFDVKANKKFSHKDEVSVNLTATDNSTDKLPSSLNFTFNVDDIAPTARITSIAPSYRDQPAHVLNVSLNTRFALSADDNDGSPTGIESIRYRILGGGPSSAETVYTSPFKINDAPGIYTGPRLYQIQYWAEDAVGNFNRNFNVTTVYVDDTPPALFQFFPQGRFINATFVDDRVGVNRSVVWYRENNNPYLPLPLVEKDAAWSLTLPEGVKGDRVSYYLQAWDRLDNTETFGNATAPYASFDVSNHEPRVKILAPIEGSRIFRSVELNWEASDDDNDALVFTIFYKAPGKPSFVELAKIENSAARKYNLDTTRFPDGQYTLRIAASDGGFVKLAETTITIVNRASAVGVVNVVGDAKPGESMLIKAEITKAEAIVEARLFLDGKLVDAYSMNDLGKDGDEVANDGIYSVRVPITSAGDYSVEIFTQYREDGELKESSLTSAATFNAKLTPSYLLAQYGATLAIIGLLAAVGIGVAVFVVVRRR